MKKFAGRPQKVNTDVVGLDVHKDVIAYAHLDAQGAEVGCGTVPSNAGEVLSMLRQCAQGRPLHVALEASGGMLWLYDLLVDTLGANFVHVAHPRSLRAIANSKQKNDANDAYWLAYFTFEGRLPECWMPPAHIRELRVAVRARIEAVQLRSRVIVMLKCYLRQLGVKLPTQRLDSDAAMAQVRELAATTEGALGMALQITLRRYEALCLDVETWDAFLDNLAKEIPAVETVCKHVPGVGRILAAVIVAESGPLERFHSHKAYGKYAGITPSDRSTGGRTIHGGITREGSRYLRWALTQAVIHCMHSSRELGSGPQGAVARWVDAKQKRTAGRAKVRVAAARKMATAIWWLFHDPKTFSVFKAFTPGALPQTD